MYFLARSLACLLVDYPCVCPISLSLSLLRLSSSCLSLPLSPHTLRRSSYNTNTTNTTNTTTTPHLPTHLLIPSNNPSRKTQKDPLAKRKRKVNAK
ncbi:hypothetical protein BKA81DRAFT_350116, partial [Phyllosticta paracitricarpa]